MIDAEQYNWKTTQQAESAEISEVIEPVSSAFDTSAKIWKVREWMRRNLCLFASLTR